MLPKDWVYLIPENDAPTHIVYAPLHKIAFRVLNEAVNAFDAVLNGDGVNHPEVKDFLTGYGLLTAPKKWLAPLPVGPGNPTKATLSLTNKCNLRCIYCYAITGLDFTTLEWPVVKATIDTLIANAVAAKLDNVSVTFHGGGEATVEWKLLQRAVGYLEEEASSRGIRTNLSGVTNTSLITLEKAQWLKQHFRRLTVSLDGPEDIHDYQRPKANGKGSFADVMRGIRNLQEVGLPFALRITVTDYGVERMVEMVEFFAQEIFPNGGTAHFEPLSVCGRANENSLSTDPMVFAQNFASAKARGTELGLNVTCSMDTFNKLKRSFCGACTGRMFCVAPNGDVSGCSRVTKPKDEGADLYFYGVFDSASSSFQIDQPQVQAIHRYGTVLEESCQTCFARWNCQGHCAISRYSYGDEHNAGVCQIVRSLLFDSILESLSVNS